MKLVSPKLPHSVWKENRLEFNFHIFIDNTFGKFEKFKSHLTDSQNRILDSKPMSMEEFELLMVDMNFLIGKTNNELYKNYNY